MKNAELKGFARATDRSQNNLQRPSEMQAEARKERFHTSSSQ
jgi:hypothetical protein